MSLKVKARERLLKFSKDEVGMYRYVMQPELYSTLTQDKVIKEAAMRSGVSEGVMQACWKAAGAVIRAWATEGHSVPLPGLGNMRFSLSARAVEDVNDVKSSLIQTRRILFTASTELKEELRKTSILITCYDRDGNLVKRVTSADDGTVEGDGSANSNQANGNPTTDNTAGGGGYQGNPEDDTQSGGNSGSSGSSGSGTTTSVAAPVISDDANITANGTVHVTCATQGASMYYTVGMDSDPADPTNQSTPVPANGTIVANESYSEDAHLKVIAYKDGVYSTVASKTIPARQDD